MNLRRVQSLRRVAEFAGLDRRCFVITVPRAFLDLEFTFRGRQIVSLGIWGAAKLSLTKGHDHIFISYFHDVS